MSVCKHWVIDTMSLAHSHAQVSPPDFHPENDQMTVMRAAVSQSHMDDEALEDLSKVG